MSIFKTRVDKFGEILKEEISRQLQYAMKYELHTLVNAATDKALRTAIARVVPSIVEDSEGRIQIDIGVEEQ